MGINLQAINIFDETKLRSSSLQLYTYTHLFLSETSYYPKIQKLVTNLGAMSPQHQPTNMSNNFRVKLKQKLLAIEILKD